MKNAINLIDNILKNMEYVRLLFKRDEGITPLHTFDLVVKQLNRLRVILGTDYLTPDQIREAVIRLEKPIKREKPYYVEVENPIEKGDFLDNSSFYRDSVGGEEIDQCPGKSQVKTTNAM